jgi:hypothetical protein
MTRAVAKPLAGALALWLALVAVACGADAVAFEDIEPSRRFTEPGQALCGQPAWPDPDTEPTDPTPLPYPTPAGEEVEPRITGIPVPAGSVQIDSFQREFTTVQVFETEASVDEVFDFYDAVMAERGWYAGGSGRGPNGFMCEYLSDRVWSGVAPDYRIEVTTMFVPRPEEEPAPGEPPPGFRGKGFGYAPRKPDKTTFSLITPRR